MMERKQGSIVNFHSVEGMRGYPGDPVYAAMKAGADHFTTSLAVTVGRYGIRVNGIGPDLTQTPQVDYIGRDEGRDDLWQAWAPVGRTRLARRPGAGRAVPRVGHVQLRDGPQRAGRRRHQGGRRVVLVAAEPALREPAGRAVSGATG